MSIKPEFQHIIDAQTSQAIGKIGVLYGGLSSERQVSLWSGEAIYNALITAGLEAQLIDVDQHFLTTVSEKNFDWAFLALHGRGGEDGTVQAILDWAKIPYVGSGVSASAIAMDKVRCKQLWQAAGLPVLPQAILSDGFDADEIIAKVGLPMAVKPALEGSSNGISKVSCKTQLQAAYDLAKQHDSVIMAESWVDGEEYTGGIIGNDALPLIHIRVDNGLYDYNTKYVTGANEYRCPCGLSPQTEKQLQELVLQAGQIIGIKDWGRVDLMIDRAGKAWLIEINTIPGMTENSLIPKAAKVFGLDFSETVLTLLKTSWESYHA